MARLAAYVTPRASRDEVCGWRGSELHIKVRTAPERGRANAAACRVVAGVLGVPKTAVTVASGGSSRHKVLEIDGADSEQLAEAFAKGGCLPGGNHRL